MGTNAPKTAMTGAGIEDLLQLIIDIQRGEGIILTESEIAIVRTNLRKRYEQTPASES